MLVDTQIILTADTGMMLTDGKSFGKVVYLGKNDSQDNWYEITDEQAKELQQKQGAEKNGD